MEHMHATKSSRAQVRADTGSWRERWKRTQTDSWERGPQLATPRPLGGTLLLLLLLGCCALSQLPTTQPRAIAAVLILLLQFVRSPQKTCPCRATFLMCRTRTVPSAATTVLQRQCCNDSIQPQCPYNQPHRTREQNARPITSQMCHFIFTGIRVAARLI